MYQKSLYLILSCGLLFASAPAYAISPAAPSSSTTPTVTVPKSQSQTGATVVVPKTIQSTVNNLVNKDPNIRKIEVDDTTVKMDYQQKTKLFGLIPVKFNLHVTAAPAKKDIKLGRPWWTIFGKTNVRKILSDLKTGLDATNLGSNLSSNQNKVIQTISNTLKKSAT